MKKKHSQITKRSQLLLTPRDAFNYVGGPNSKALGKQMINKKTEKQCVEEHCSMAGMLGDARKLDRVGRDDGAKVLLAAEGMNAERDTGLSTGAGKTSSTVNSGKRWLLNQLLLVEGEDPQEFRKFEEGVRADLKPRGVVEEYYVDRWIKDSWLLNRFDNVITALLVSSESLDDLSISEVFDHLKFLTAENGRRFDEIPEIFKFLKEAKRSEEKSRVTTQNKPDSGSPEESRPTHTKEFLLESAELSSSELIFVKHLNDRLRKASLTANRARSCKSPTEAYGAAGERGALSTETAMNAMARTFIRNREAITLATRYRAKIERSHNNGLHELQRLQAIREGQVVAAPEIVDVNVNFTEGGKNRE
jgi:hypothetical protein